MARPRISPDPTVRLSIRLGARDQERLAACAASRGLSEAEAARIAIVAWINGTEPTKSEPLGLPLEGGGGVAESAPPSDAPSRPEVQGGGESSTVEASIAAPPHPEPRGEAAQSGDRDASVAASSPPPPETPTQARARRQDATKAHRHTPAKAGMPVPRCGCGAIRKLDGTWHLETRPELDAPDSQEDEW